MTWLTDEGAEEMMRRLYERRGGIAWRDERIRLRWYDARQRLRDDLNDLVALGIVAPARALSDAQTRALIESLRAICKRWNDRAEKHRCGYQCNGADHDADKFASEIEDALEAASRSESTDARRVATPGFAEADGPRCIVKGCNGSEALDDGTPHPRRGPRLPVTARAETDEEKR